MRSFALASLASVALAANPTVNFFMPGLGEMGAGADPDASIVKANPSTTVMALACPTNVDETECGWGQQDLTVTVMGTTKFAFDMEMVSGSLECNGKGDMTCTAVIPQEFTDEGDIFTAGTDGKATGTTVYPSSQVSFVTATVTAGADKLTGGSDDASKTSAKETTAKETGTAKETASTSQSTLATSAASTGATPSSSGSTPTNSNAPPESSGAASRFGMDSAALIAMVGVAAVHVL